jgi:hypothetical protein
MEIQLTTEESAAVQAALRSYVSNLRMEIVDTDNPEYKRTLREERGTLESALAKIDAGATGATTERREETVCVVRLWWSASRP